MHIYGHMFFRSKLSHYLVNFDEVLHGTSEDYYLQIVYDKFMVFCLFYDLISGTVFVGKWAWSLHEHQMV